MTDTTDTAYPILINHKPWIPPPIDSSSDDCHVILEAPFEESFKENFRVVHRELAKDRMPENRYDMTLYASKPGTIMLNHSHSCKRRLEVPNVPGAFVLQSVLSRSECQQIVSAAETLGFSPDEPISGSASELQSILAHNVFWLADKALMEGIYDRCRDLLPQTLYTDSQERVQVSSM